MSFSPRSRRPQQLLRAALLAVGLGAAGATPALTATTADAAIVERVVAIVGPRAILLTDLRERALPFLVHVYATVPEGPGRAANISQVYKVVLNQMIDEELEETAARKAGVEISEAQVDQALAQTAAQNGLSVNAILAEAKRTGLSVKNYREELRRQLIQRAMVEIRLRGRIRVTDQDVRAAYRRLQTEERMRAVQRTQQLRIPQGKTAKERATQKALAERIAAEAKAGTPLRDLIAKHATGANSGLRAPLPPMQEPAAIQRATVALEVGETSRPLRMEGSWVILQVIERPPSQLPPYAEARQQMHERVYLEKITAARQNWLKGLRRRTHVEVRL